MSYKPSLLLPPPQPTTLTYYHEPTPITTFVMPSYAPRVLSHPYDRPPPPPAPRASEMNLVARRRPEEIPVLTRLMNTVAEAQSRKRQHEDQEYHGRHYGQQTGMDEDTRLSEEPIISQTKRFRIQGPTPAPREITREDAGTNTTPPPESDLPSTSTRDPTRPQRFNSPSARQARRARRQLRTQQDIQRMVEGHSYLQQVNGLVPSGDHSCDPNCVQHHRHHVVHNIFNQATTIPIAPAVAPNMIPPAVAPMMMESPYVYHSYFNIAPTMPTHIMIPPPVPPLAVPVPIRPTQTYQPYSFHNPHQDYILEMLRAQTGYISNYHTYPALDRALFVGLEIDVPIGATRAEIDNNSTTYKYLKEAGKEETCTVCLTDFETGDEIRKIRCNHLFHPGCIDKWLDINKKCPMCRKEIDKGEGEEPTPPVFLGQQPPPIPPLMLS